MALQFISLCEKHITVIITQFAQIVLESLGKSCCSVTVSHPLWPEIWENGFGVNNVGIARDSDCTVLMDRDITSLDYQAASEMK